jgi:hypothetical protein
MSDPKQGKSPYTLWTLRRVTQPATADSKERSVHVGDLILHPKSGTLRLDLFVGGGDAGAFPVFKRDPEKQTDAGVSLWDVKSKRERSNEPGKFDFRTVGQLRMSDASGTGELSLNLFDARFVVRAKEAKQDESTSEAA